jgi:hypothetical protein
MTSTNVRFENHESRLRELESHDGNMMKKVEQILEVRLPSIETKIEKLDTKITIIAALNIGAIILSKLIQ